MKVPGTDMRTNLQILTEEGTITAVVEPEKKITAAYQNMRAIPNVLVDNYAEWVEVLDLSHNKLRDISCLGEMQNLHTLILDHNLIVSTTVFPKLPRLRVLWLNFNLISEVALFIPALSRSCPNLRYLSLMGNLAAPVITDNATSEAQDIYRQYVISHFDHLRYLDDQPVAVIERIKCVKEEPSFLELLRGDMRDMFHDIREALNIKIPRKLNAIV
ncbi:leucine-rich melanocyte differentiation-associated protein-like [Argiope bruennichi]|uniref:leucine-rich melanocyte differentiation-associated protein-like n=1 Tax=Argiope bruennichi TaxID=94029 RepID=UPI002493E378|nr:leucine-rich melanocyte differentiation-associated protein-like [Argiope bruennichi]